MNRDHELTILWRDGGRDRDGNVFRGCYQRRQDGLLYHTDTGQPCAAPLAVPEQQLPPLPDGTRPAPSEQIVGVEQAKTWSPPPWVAARRAREARRDEALRLAESQIASEAEAAGAPTVDEFTTA